MLKLIGKFKGIQPKRNNKGYLVGIDGDGFMTNIIHVKEEDKDDFKDLKKGQDVEIPVYPFSFENSSKVQFSYNKKF